MKIRYYCPECRNLRILNAIYTAEKRVCAWCGITIHPEHVEQQSHHQRKIFGFFYLVPLVAGGYYFPSFLCHAFDYYKDHWILAVFLLFFPCQLWLACLCGFLMWCLDDNTERTQLLNKQRDKQREERAPDQK